MVEIIAREETYCTGTLGNLVLAVWRQGFTVEIGREFALLIGRQCETLGAAGMISVVEVGSSMPDAAARAALADVLKKYDGKMLGVATVFEGTGFKAAALRATITSITLLMRSKSPSKVFGSTAEGAAWLAPLLSAGKNGVAAGDIEAAIGEMRRSE